VKAYKCDTADSQQVDRSVEEIHNEFGKHVDIAICNAGMYCRHTHAFQKFDPI
jgi:NAD(P)-dependent dehydrogenase (short-subunit alcohol dehydrogenase family)